MAKINTLNYQTVAAWNGSQDLFVVEQPDGTKVATPAQVKQFMEAGDFEATGEVKDGHGNILKDMAKSADVNTALAGKQNTLTFDTTPTAGSTEPVTSGGIKTYVDDKYLIKGLTLGSSLVVTAGNFVRADIPCVESGYTPLGILSVQGAATAGQVSLMEFGLSADNTKVFIYYANDSATNKTLSDVRVRVLYRKN